MNLEEIEKRLKKIEEHINLPKGVQEPQLGDVRSSIVSPVTAPTAEEERLDTEELLRRMRDMLNSRFEDLESDIYEGINEYINNENNITNLIRRIRVGTQIRLAYVKTTPGAVTSVACYLDTDATGEEISVVCRIADGSGGTTKLNAAIPRLTDGDELKVVKIGTTWHCLDKFIALDADHFQITSGKLQDKLSTCV